MQFKITIFFKIFCAWQRPFRTSRAAAGGIDRVVGV
jgi:hypothetical protein